MLTEDDIQKIQSLKEKGYAKAKVAKTLGLSRGSQRRITSEVTPRKFPTSQYAATRQRRNFNESKPDVSSAR